MMHLEVRMRGRRGSCWRCGGRARGRHPPVARPLVTTACCAMIWTQRIEYVDCLKESAPRNAVGDAKL